MDKLRISGEIQIFLIVLLLTLLPLQEAKTLSKRELAQNGEWLTRSKRNVDDVSILIEKCDRENQRMVVRGENVTLSKLLHEDGHLWCRHARKLEIFALDSLIIDADLIPGNESLSSVAMVGKNWVVLGNRKFDMRGTDGKPIPTRASDGNQWHHNGMDGVPGNPGGNGGNFYGLFDNIVKGGGSSLEINVNGGNGGSGQDGGNGRNGEAGEDGNRKDFPSPYSELDSKMERLRHLEFNILYGYRYKNYILHGKLGTGGGNAGNGGAGGLGGNAGFVNVTCTNGGILPITISKERGFRGFNGKGGLAGLGGKHGEGMQCTWRGILADTIRWWDKCHHVPKSKIADELFASAGVPGKNGGNGVGIRQPKPANSMPQEFSNAEENFKRFVAANA